MSLSDLDSPLRQSMLTPPEVLWSRFVRSFRIYITFNCLWRLFNRAHLLWGPSARAISARVSSAEGSLGPCSTPSAGRLLLFGEKSGCGPCLYRLAVAEGQLVWLAPVSSCGDACRQGLHGCVRSLLCGAQRLSSLILRR